MKKVSKEWIAAAEDDLEAAKALVSHERLTHLAAFHCQQSIEKAFKAIVEEENFSFIKSHDLLRLQNVLGITFDKDSQHVLEIINEVYIDACYPGEFGLLPNGKPSKEELESFISITEYVLSLVLKRISN
jgi:HEPN domain-containing protein